MTSAVIIFVTLPLIPIFMILIGLLTKGKSEKTLAAMTTLSSQTPRSSCRFAGRCGHSVVSKVLPSASVNSATVIGERRCLLCA